ncbi:hypothetical protein [Tenacibaculum sp. 190524A02b]|uniref:hypothetical protein n=1 Tax=Tenacibaculum vairaonense TaxID=3137860 RepID=UPI0031FB9DE0
MTIRDFKKTQAKGLGFFDNLCPSRGIARNLVQQARNILEQKAEYERKYEELKKGDDAREWADVKANIKKYEDNIERETILLNKEKGIADAIGIGLGAWCNEAVSLRQRAERLLAMSNEALGKIRGSYETLEKQQTEGIKIGHEKIIKLKKDLESVRQQIALYKKKIADYKAKRDNKAKSQSQSDKAAATNGKLKENTPMIIGAVAVGALLLYMIKNKPKKTKVTTPQKVVV